jgi:hypothetical protein
MASLSRHFWPCLDAIRQSVNSGKKITYQELADKLRLKSAKQEWYTVLDVALPHCNRSMRYDWNKQYAALHNRTYKILYDAGIDEKLANELAAQRVVAVAVARVSKHSSQRRLITSRARLPHLHCDGG